MTNRGIMAGRAKAYILKLASLAACAIAFWPPSCFAALNYTGVNLAGADFGENDLPGTYNTHYTYPTSGEVDYFIGKGMNTFRLPFRWERLQQSLNAPFNSAEFNRLNNFVNYATGQGAYVVLDPHNYARYHGGVIGGGSVSNASFGDFWSRLANQYRNNERVIFGLMNEPNTMPTEQWRDAANAAIVAIRNTGATNLVLVPGNAWTGAHSWTQNWYGTPNSVAMLGIVDPENNFAFDVHQYLDDNSAGDDPGVVNQNIGQQRLVQFTDWMHANNRRGFLGEFAVANSTIGTNASQIGDEAIHNMLNYIQANTDVWLGWTWWAAGPWWGNYMFTLEPINLGQPGQTDRPTMAVLQPHLAVSSPDVAGDFNRNGTVDAADYVHWRRTLNQTVQPGAGADADRNGVIQQADFSFWRANFGAISSGSASMPFSTEVPEPPSLLLLAVSVACHRWRRLSTSARR
jgi:endoglucanase